MGNWGIANTAPENEKIKAEFNDFINGLNCVGKIDYDTLSELFDFTIPLFDRMFALGKKKKK